jgi:hypothetical protein
MRSILSSTKAANSIRNNSFSSLVIKGNTLILTNKQEEETIILISELQKIYISKRQFSFFLKIGVTMFPLFLLVICYNYFPVEILLFGCFLLFFPLFVKLNNYKWYHLHLVLTEGRFFKKVFYTTTKQEQIDIVNSVKKEIYYNHVKSNFEYEKPAIVYINEANYSNLSIV